jgi:hypothetical protein
MLGEVHLDAAVAEGIITAPQALALRDFAARREHARAVALGHEERFRFMRGFNDFFLATGVVLLGAGLMFFTGTSVIGKLVAALLLWTLAEVLVRRMRLVLPGILLVCFFVAALYRAIPIDLFPATPGSRFIATSLTDLFTLTLTNAPVTMALKGLVGSGAAALFYARFRLPFALLLVAGGLVLGSISIVGPDARALVLLLSGLAVFASAMAFDISDRERTTRRADCAFWLHLLAAPLIVHSLIAMAVPGLDPSALTSLAAFAIVLIVLALALVALLIDRRALLVSTLSYLGLVIAYAIRTAGADAPSDHDRVFFATLVLLGLLVLGLGVGWQPLRRALLLALPKSVTERLPPAAPAWSTPEPALTR